MVEEKNKLYVGNLPYSFGDMELAAAFEAYGVVDAKVIMDKFSNPDRPRSRGFGFVTVQDDATAEKAVEEMNGKEIEGRALVVNIARPMEKRERTGDRGGYNRR